MQQDQDFDQSWISHTIENVLALTPGADDTLAAQHTELLRQCGLADVELRLQVTAARRRERRGLPALPLNALPPRKQ